MAEQLIVPGSWASWHKNPKNGRIIMADGQKVVTCHAKGSQAWTDAEYVLLAVHSHDALLAACKAALKEAQMGYVMRGKMELTMEVAEQLESAIRSAEAS